jgi:hypothetical protein
VQLMIISVILAVGSGFSGRIMPTNEIPHRVLHEDRLTAGRMQTAFYAVDVEGLLTRADIERVVCQTLGKQKPEPLSRVQISIYRGLDRYIPPDGDPVLEAKLRDHAVANYIWNINAPQARDGLTIVKGQVVGPQSYPFDHTTMCN